MRTTTTRVDVAIEDDDGREIVAECVVIDTPPSGMSGPPEDYDPGEVEVEILHVTRDGAVYAPTADEDDAIEEAALKKAARGG